MAKQKKVKFVSADKYIGLNGQKPNMSANGRFNYDTPEEYKKKKSGIRFMSPEEYNEQKHIQAYKNQLEYYKQRQLYEDMVRQEISNAASRNTDVWRNNAVSDTAKTGNTFQTYQEKMKIDTHGGLSGEGYHDYLRAHPTPEMKRTDEWKKLDKKAKYSPELKDESAYIAKMMYDSHTQTPTQRKYIPGGPQLKKAETAADKTGQSMGDYLAGIKQKKEEKTKQTDWQAQTAHAQNSADPWGKYAEVYEQKAKSGNASQKTTDDWKKATQASALLADNPNLAYGAKMAGVTPDEFVQQLQGTNQQEKLNEQKDNRAASLIEGKTDLGHWLGGTTEDVQETMRSGYASGFRGDLDRLIEEKYFDEGEDPYLMSDEGRANLRAKYETGILSYQKQLEELDKQIAEQEKPANGWDPMLELYSTPEIENERKIIEGDGYTEEEKQAAMEHLNWLLNRNTGYGSQSANDRARSFYRYNIHNITDLRDHMDMDNMRRMAYDAMNGNGAYEKATAGMNPEERAALDEKINNVLDYIADPDGSLGAQKRTAQAQIEYAQGKIAEIDRLNAQEAKYAEMMAGVDELGDVEIDPATVGTSRNSLLQNQYTAAHPVEYVAAILSGDYNEDVWINDLQYGQALLMSDDEKKKFAYLYTHEKKNEAWAFYQGLEPMLNQMYHYFEDLSIQQTARRAPITATVATFGMHLAQPVEALINLPEQLASAVFDTGSGVTDPYSSRYLVTRLKNGIRAQVSEDVGDWDWVYNGFTSGVDSALNVSIGKALGLDGKFLNIAGKKIPAMQAATLALFHTQAFETSLQNTLTQGNDQFGYDFIEAWIDAAVETATEIWSVENWMADPTNILRYVGKIAISEPSEEIVGAIIEPYIKEMLGHKNQYKERAKQILVDGGYTDGQGNWVKVEDMDTATRQAMREWNHDIRMAAQEALISVGPSIVYGSARMATDTNRTGRAIQSNNVGGEQNATRELAEAAARMNPETESYKQSQKMLERLKSGEQISNYDAGKLATNIIRETNEQIGNTARQVLQDRVAEDLQSKGMQAEEAQEFAGLITSALEENGIDNLTKKQRSKINGNNAALQTYMSYRFSAETLNKTAKAQLKATEGDRQSRFTVEALMMDRKTNDNLDVGEQMATDEEKRNATGKAVKGPMGIIYNNQHARLGSLMKDENGKLKYQVYLEGQKEPVLADASEIGTTHLGTAAIMRSQVRNPGFYSQGYVNAMLQTMNDRRMENIPGKLMRDAELLRYAAYEQVEMPKTELPADIAKMLYDYSRYEYIERRAAETSNAKNRTIKPGQGYVTYKGIKSETAEFDQLFNKLSKEEKQYIRMMDDVAKAGGIELGLMDINDIMNSDDPALQQFKPEPGKLYGAEKDSRITINLGGQIFTKNEQTGKWEASGQKHNIVVTLGHETVHWLQENTRDGYDNLARYVMDEQRRILGTQGLNDRLEQIMNSQGVDLYGAVSELVADSSDNIFFNKKVIDHIQQTNKGLYQNLKNFAKNLIARIRAAFSSMSQDSKRLGNEVGSRMAELFNLAWDEATSGELVYDEKEYSQVQKMQEDDKGVRFSNYNGLGLEEITQDQRVNIINRGNIIAETEKDLIDFIHKARADKKNQFQKTAFVGTISDKAKNLLTKESGISNLFKDGAYVLGIRADDVRHYDKHFKTDADVAQAIIDTLGMLMDHDTIDPTVMKNGKIKIVLQKGNNSIQLLSVTEYSKSQRATTIKSVYLTKGNIENWRKLNRVVTLSSLRNSTRSPLHNNNITQHITNGNIHFSQAQVDSDYMAAVENGNVEAAQQLVDETATKAGYTDNVYHGTESFGFTEFDMRKSQNQIFVAYDKEISDTYSRDAEIRRVLQGKQKIDYANMPGEELAERYYETNKENLDNNKENVFYLPKEKVQAYKDKLTKDYLSIISKEAWPEHYNTLAEMIEAFEYDGISTKLAKAKEFASPHELAEYVLDQLNNHYESGMGDTYRRYLAQIAMLYGNADLNEEIAKKNLGYNGLYYFGETLMRTLQLSNSGDFIGINLQGGPKTSYFTLNEMRNWMTSRAGNNGTYALKAKPGNQFVVDAKRHYWNNIDVPGHPELKNTRQIARWAKEQGYDSVRINNVYDHGGRGKASGFGDIGIFFNQGDVKSGDPITYDQNGNIIPPSERFNTEKTDIRWSRAQVDNDYLTAVENGDEQTQRQILDEAAKKNGYTMKVYHGTPTGGFTVFRDWSYFTEKKEYADRYNHPSQSSTRGYAVDATQPMTYELYMNPGRVFDTRNSKEAKLFEQIRMEYGMGQLTDNGLPDWTDGRDLIEYIEENNLPYDTIILNEGADGGYGAPVVSRGESYVSRSNMVKSADLVTYDDEGNVIPPSERFNKQKNDIRFSMAQPVEQTRNLIAVHNLTEQNLIDTLAEGGFTAPSIAVIRAATGHSKFGEISVVFNKDTIDPRRSSKNKVYGTDAWTPTRSNAQIKTKLDYNKMLAAQRHVQDIMEGVQPELAHEASRWIGEKAYHEDTTKTIDDWVLEGLGNEGLLAAYMAEKGMEIPIQYRQMKNNSDLHEEHEEMYKEFLSELERHGMLDDFMREMGEASEDYLLEKWGGLFAQVGDETHKKIVNNALEKGGMSKRVAARRLAQVWMYEQAGRKIETHDEFDQYATRQAMQNVIDRNDFEKWMKDLLGDAFGERGVYNGVDPYDSMGNRRSWKRTHMAPTAENIVKAMYRNHDAKGGEAGRATGLMAKASKEYRNISEIREDQDRLQMMQDEEYSKLVENLDSELSDFWNELSENSELGQYSISGIMIDAAETYAKTGSISAFAAKMKQEGITLTPAQIEKAQQLMDEAREIPTGYFEAKPERVVGLDEIEKVILPDNTSDELLRKLDENGVSYEFYDGTDEDRLEKLNEQESAKFSRWTEDGLDVNTWMMNATPSTFQTEDEQALWQAYKDLRIKMSLSLHRQNEYQAKIKQLENKANLTAEERDELTANRNRLEIQQKKLADMEDELYQVTSSEGYAGMMYRQNMVLKDYIQGKTQDQVRQTVEGMLKEVQRAQEEIKRDRADLLKLAETQAIKTVESYMSKSSLGKMASMLRSNYNSAMSKGEIQSRLAEMALKQAQGEDITSDAEQLAQDLLDKMRGIQTDALQQLKGTTLKISEELAKEMRAENLTMADLRRQLKGSGVTIKTEKGANIRQQWAEMYDQNQSLPNIDEDYSESGALHHILDFIQGEVDASRGVNQNEVNFDEVAAVVKIAAGNITTYLVDDPAARRQIENLMGQVKELAGKTGAIAEKMDALDKKMDEVVLAGQKAKGWTTILQRDVNDAIKYYNKTARVAAQVEKTKVRKALIEQLRSENTKKLLAQQDAFRERLKNDKTARELAQDNMIIRRKINTVAGRMAQRLFAETDQKNIPEETKALARQMMQMLTMHDSLHRKVTFMDRQQLRDITERLQKLAATEGTFNADTDLSWLIIGEGADADTSLVDRVMQDLVDIESGLLEYRTAEGQKNVTLQDRKNALLKVQKALSEIWSMIQARGQAQIQGRKMQILDLAMMMEEDMADSRFKGERIGFGRGARNAVTGAINYGNLTPEYFFKNLKNRAMDQLKLGLNDAENRGGLEAAKAKAKIAQLAAETGFNSWDGQEKHEIDVANGKKVTATTEQIMSLYATWLRERNATRPEETAHLLKGGFVLTPNEEGGKPGRQKTVQRPIRITWNQLNKLGSYLTEEQKRWVDGVVAYMSGELAELGNEASMQMYGIKKFTEKYYFPIRSWGGVLNSRSDAGVSSQNENRAAQQSFTKRIKANANNAVQISDFTPTAMKHITGMITFNTIGPAVENINKVLNQQLTYDENKGNHEGLPTEENEELDTSYRRNMAAAFQEAYGKQAFDYLKTFMKDLNGGFARRQEVLLREKLLSIFKKNAVAGSLSVAAQQPLSYIRAAMMINPKYLAAAISPQYWKGSYAEMMKYSGVAVIKEMGKFDMNYGQTMQDYIAPEGMESKARRAWNKVSDVMTAGPQKMDAMTWTRMWTAVKLEMAAQNPGVDMKSDEFLTKVAERFNDLMRRTQVYDSVMVKSQNMRSDNYLKKVATSFMAEPTLSLNVLEDAWANRKESGGKKNVIKALATFLLSAAAQAGAKAFFGTGRTPDKKKNKEENFLNKFGYNILSEVNPLGLIPGYSQIINVLTDGELKDDAMGVLGKAVEVWDRIFQLATGKGGDKGLYRDLEDSIGQLLQLTTDIPAKNLMRDFRAMVNFFSGGEAQGFTGDGYAHRPTSNAVLKYQALDTFMSNDLIGLINKRLGEAGYGTSNKDYYTRIYNAERSGNQAAADEMKEYLLQGKGVSEETLNKEIRPMYKNDDSLSSEEKLEKQKEYGLKQTTSYITSEYKAGNLTREAAERLYREENPNAKDKNVMELFDKIDWEKAGHDAEGYTNYTPLMTAIENNKVEEIRAAVDHMVKNGYEVADIKQTVNKNLKKEYMAATSESEKLRIRDALTKTYKALGYDASEADKTVQKWINEAKKNK